MRSFHHNRNHILALLFLHCLSPMDSLHNNPAGAAALQRHRIREKMSSIVLEHDPSAADALPFASLPTQYQAAAQNSGQDTAEVATANATTKTLPFPSPARNYIGLEGMTQTVIDDDNISSRAGAPKTKRTSPSQSTAEMNNNRGQSIKSQLRSLTLTKSSGRRGAKRHCDENIHSPMLQMTAKTNLGDIYDVQLDRRAMTSSKMQKIPNHHCVLPTTRGRRTKSRERNYISKDAVSSPLAPVKRCLYQNDEEDEEELLTPTRMAEDNGEMANHHSNHPFDQSGDEGAFATIGHFLRV